MKFRTITSRADSTPTVLLPGWATDYKIFDTVTLPTSIIVPLEPITDDLSADLAAFLKEQGIRVVNLFGWSLGGAAALQIAGRCPEIIERIILAGVRPAYPSIELDAMRRALVDDKESCLTNFYRRCFLPAQRDDYRRFKQTLLADYVSFDRAMLLRGLDLLEAASFTESDLQVHDITVLHGTADAVAPVNEIVEVASRLGTSRIDILDDAGHAVFLHPRAREVWRNA